MKPIALIATRKGLFKLDSEHNISEVAFIGDPVSMVLTDNKNNVWYAALDLGHFGVKLHRSDDQGQSWKEVSAPSYPQTDDKAKGDSLELIWCLEFAEPGHPDKLWAGTVPGGLFYSEDGGLHWTLNQTLWQFKQQQEWFGGGFDHAGIHSICVDPRDHNEIKVAVSCAGVWVTKDAGKTWQNQSEGMRAAYMPPEQEFDPIIQDPHRLVQCPSNPDVLWVQHHNGIFSSIDNSQSWQEYKEVPPSTFGFATVVHPQDANKAWFVPGIKDESRIPVAAQLVVTRTTDGGKTFESLSEGLPQQACYDLVFRHALDIDTTGEKLLMGSTTGNLWLSDNQGDKWQCLSNYLPPIYAIRFIE
jgi:photosystem II stability/assembly factor-like uncharacterized protein